jgi:hypothetical protein
VGCAHEESEQPKLRSATIRVLDQEGKTVSGVVVGITVVIIDKPIVVDLRSKGYGLV